MTDKVIHVNVTSTKSQRVSVSPGNVQNEITATPDSSQYYSNLAKNWAIGAGLILNEDYSSKHYAKESANSASSAKNYADASQVTYTNVQNVANEALTDIEDARVNAVDNITTVKSESIASVEAKSNEANALVNTGIANINTVKTEAVNAVTTTKNNAVTEINKEVTDGKKELNDIIEAGGANINDKITNCLLEVPQNIKVELSDSGITLKAGSVITFPNGANNFEYYTVPRDITKPNYGSGSTDFFIMLDADKSSLRTYVVNRTTSGTTAPTGEGLWYDTTNNLVKFYNSSNELQWSGLSFPFAICTRSAGTITSVKQVFNGFGYIGNTIFCDKGVKGLIPNGRNDDGTLKNTEFTTSNVLTQTRNISGINKPLVLRGNDFSNYGVADYNEELNLNISSIGTNVGRAIVGTWSADSTGRITSFKPKRPVHLLTWDDIRINNPYFFGQYIWSEFAPSNLSWLKSSGQWNSGSGYQGFYDWALANANANKAGFKLSSTSYTDYDFVVNTSAKTFRLPIKVQNAPMGGTAPVVGNGTVLGLTTDTGVNTGLVHTGVGGSKYLVGTSNNAYGANLSGTSGVATTDFGANGGLGVTTDATNSGLIADLSQATNSKLSLYFYVGETVKDPTLIDVAQIASNFANKVEVVEAYSSGTSWYRVYSADQTGKRFCEQGGALSVGGQSVSVTLLKPYVDNTYNLTTSCNGAINPKTVSNFVIDVNYGDSAKQGFDWRACGYIA